jgi:hypothetical protein
VSEYNPAVISDYEYDPSKVDPSLPDVVNYYEQKTKTGKKRYNRKRINLSRVYVGKVTSIKISNKTRNRLRKLARFGDTYNAIIIRLVEFDKRLNNA